MNPAVRRAIVEAKGGNRPLARRLLIQELKSEPQNELAWLWLSYILDDERQSCQLLERALRIKPDSVLVQAALARIQRTTQNGNVHAPPPAAPSAQPAPERIHFQDGGILISNRRAVFPETAYTTANITAVSHVDHVSVQRTMNDNLIRVGAVLAIATAFALNLVPPGGLLAALGSVLVTGGISLLVFGWVGIPKKTAIHTVRIRSASREVDAYTTHDREVAERVIEALNNARRL